MGKRGGGGTWMNGRKKKKPSSEWQAERAVGVQFFQAVSGGGGRRVPPFSAPPLPYFSLGIEGRPPTRTSGLPGALFCLLTNAPPPPKPTCVL